jgi:hypothetical protein
VFEKRLVTVVDSIGICTADFFVSQDLANALAVSRYYDVSGSGGAGRKASRRVRIRLLSWALLDYFYRPFALV